MAMLARSESRDGYAVRVLCVHTTEGGGTAAALRDADWWTGSSHAIADSSGTLLTPAEGCVPYDLAAWTLRSGNRWSENIELVGFAAWGRADWLFRPDLLDACARWLAARSKARGIPLVKITAAQYAAGGWGVIGHVDHTNGYNDGTHWDPGPNFPYDVVLPKARAYAAGESPEDDMPTVAEFWNAKTVHPMTGKETIVIDLVKDGVRQATRAAVDGAIARKLAEAAAKGVPLSQADVDRISAATEAKIRDEIAAGYDVTLTPKTDPVA